MKFMAYLPRAPRVTGLLKGFTPVVPFQATDEQYYQLRIAHPGEFVDLSAKRMAAAVSSACMLMRQLRSGLIL